MYQARFSKDLTPKRRVGRATQLESQQVDDMEINDGIYGLEDGSTVNRSTGEVLPKQDTGFAPGPDTSTGVTINPEASADNADGGMMYSNNHYNTKVQ